MDKVQYRNEKRDVCTIKYNHRIMSLELLRFIMDRIMEINLKFKKKKKERENIINNHSRNTLYFAKLKTIYGAIYRHHYYNLMHPFT